MAAAENLASHVRICEGFGVKIPRAYFSLTCLRVGITSGRSNSASAAGSRNLNVCGSIFSLPSKRGSLITHNTSEVRFDTSTQTVHTYPLKTSPSLSTLGPKFGPVSEIAFEGFPFALPKAENEVEEQLQQLPEESTPTHLGFT